MKRMALFGLLAMVGTLTTFSTAEAATPCQGLPSWKSLRGALMQARKENNGGLNLNMWATLVDRDGVVCAVAYTGNFRDEQWPGSRVISAQKANTANAFSLPKLALSTANLFSAVQPGGSLFGLQHSNPVDTTVAYGGNSELNGTIHDPMRLKKIGGVNVFGGGLALYNDKGLLIGGIGVSGDTSCADHNIAWKTRHILNLDYVPAGVTANNDDNVIYLKTNEAPNGFKHPTCGGKEDALTLPASRALAKAAAKTEKVAAKN